MDNKYGKITDISVKYLLCILIIHCISLILTYTDTDILTDYRNLTDANTDTDYNDTDIMNI